MKSNYTLSLIPCSRSPLSVTYNRMHSFIRLFRPPSVRSTVPCGLRAWTHTRSHGSVACALVQSRRGAVAAAEQQQRQRHRQRQAGTGTDDWRGIRRERENGRRRPSHSILPLNPTLLLQPAPQSCAVAVAIPLAISFSFRIPLLALATAAADVAATLSSCSSVRSPMIPHPMLTARLNQSTAAASARPVPLLTHSRFAILSACAACCMPPPLVPGFRQIAGCRISRYTRADRQALPPKDGRRGCQEMQQEKFVRGTGVRLGSWTAAVAVAAVDARIA